MREKNYMFHITNSILLLRKVNMLKQTHNAHNMRKLIHKQKLSSIKYTYIQLPLDII